MDLLNKDIPLSRIIGGTLIVIAISVGFWLLVHFHTVLLLLLLAIIISTALKPAVHWLHRKTGLSLSSSTAAIYVSLACLTLALLAFQAPRIANQVDVVTENMTALYSSARGSMLESSNVLVRRFAFSLPIQGEELVAEIQEVATAEEGAAEPVEPAISEDTLSRTWAIATTVLKTIIRILFVFALAFYWTLEGDQIIRYFLVMLPFSKRGDAAELIETMQDKVSQYVIGQGVLCLIIGSLSFLLYFLVGLSDVLVLAIFAGLMEAIPVIGPTLGAIPALVIAITISPTHALWVALGSLAIQQLENMILVPRVMDRAVGMRPLVTLLSLFIFSLLFGTLGALVSIPLTLIIQIFLNRYVLNEVGQSDLSGGRDHNSVIRYETQQLIQDIRKHIRHKAVDVTADNDEWEDSVESLALDFDSLLAQNETQGAPG